MSGGHDAYRQATGKNAGTDSNNMCGVVHALNLLDVLTDMVNKGRYGVWLCDEQHFTVPIGHYVLHELTARRADSPCFRSTE